MMRLNICSKVNEDTKMECRIYSVNLTGDRCIAMCHVPIRGPGACGSLLAARHRRTGFCF
jgi:hypothetical protein